MLCRVLFSYPLLYLFLTGLLLQQSLLKCYSAWASSGAVLRRALRGQGAPAIHCKVGVSPLLSQDGASTKAKHRDKQDVQYEDGDRTAGNGATRVMDWEQESETRDRRLCHSQQHGILGTEEKLGKGSRGHMCSWTCLSGMSVSPPHPCIQSPVLTCQLGPAGLQTCRQSPGLHPSGRSAFQHQQCTRVLLRTYPFGLALFQIFPHSHRMPWGQSPAPSS